MESLFRKTESALTFAFHHSAQVYERPTMSKMAAPAISTGLGLGGLDGAAQSAFIRMEVQRLGKIAEAILLARFAPHSMPCSCKKACCSGHTRNKEWTDSISFLADHVRRAALAGCVCNGAMRLDYIRIYFGAGDKTDNFPNLARQHSTHEQTIRAHYRKVKEFFAGHPSRGSGPEKPPGMEQLARNAIDEVLWDLGICGKNF